MADVTRGEGGSVARSDTWKGGEGEGKRSYNHLHHAALIRASVRPLRRQKLKFKRALEDAKDNCISGHLVVAANTQFL